MANPLLQGLMTAPTAINASAQGIGSVAQTLQALQQLSQQTQMAQLMRQATLRQGQPQSQGMPPQAQGQGMPPAQGQPQGQGLPPAQGQGSAFNPIAMMGEVAMRAIQAGNPQGMALYNSVVKMQDNAARMAALQVHAQAAQLNSQVNAQKLANSEQASRMQFLYGELDRVHDQAGWDAFTRQLGQYQGTPYDPMTVDGLKAQALGARGMAEVKARQASLDERVLQDRTMNAMRAVSNRIAETRAALAAQRNHITAQLGEERLANRKVQAKVSGTAPVPNLQLTSMAQTHLERAYPDLNVDEALGYAQDAASRAMVLMKQSPGLDASTALNQAIAELKGKIPASISNDTGWWNTIFGHHAVPDSAAALAAKPAAPLHATSLKELQDWYASDPTEDRKLEAAAYAKSKGWAQ